MRKKINIAIVGFGNIGSYFYKTLVKNQKKIAIKTGKIPFIKYICVKNINKKRQYGSGSDKKPSLKIFNLLNFFYKQS